MWMASHFLIQVKVDLNWSGPASSVRTAQVLYFLPTYDLLDISVHELVNFRVPDVFPNHPFCICCI